MWTQPANYSSYQNTSSQRDSNRGEYLTRVSSKVGILSRNSSSPSPLTFIVTMLAQGVTLGTGGLKIALNTFLLWKNPTPPSYVEY